MSSFQCEHCGKEIMDSPSGYTTECEHYPVEVSGRWTQEEIDAAKEEAKRIRDEIGWK